jgi:hypothetical protein
MSSDSTALPVPSIDFGTGSRRVAVCGTDQVGRLHGVLASRPAVEPSKMLAGRRFRDTQPMGRELDRTGGDVGTQDLELVTADMGISS